MNSICRLCLGEKVKLHHILESEVINGWTSADAIRELLQMQVSTGDVYPQFICTECVGKLVDFKQFKEQCEINKNTLDLEYSRNRYIGDKEDVVGMVLCGNENHSEIFLKEDDVEVAVEKDPLDLSEEGNEVKAEIENTSNYYNEVPSTEVISSADNALIQRSEFKDQHRTEDCNEINAPHNTSSEAMTSNKGIPDVVGMDLRGDGNHSELFLKDEDVEVPNERDDLDSIEEGSHVKSDIEETSNVYNEVSSAEVVGSSDPRSVNEFEDQPRTAVTVDGSSESRRTCRQCNKLFSNELNLFRHKLRIHSEEKEKSFRCPECGDSFPCKRDLKRHTKVHSVEERFNCAECGKSFTQKRNFTLHMRTHSGERPFKCTLCCRTFVRKDNLKCHMRIHSGETPFQCSRCSLAFAHKCTMESHFMRMHSRQTQL